MAGNSPGITKARKEQSSLKLLTLDDSSTRECLSVFVKLVESCFGPHGKTVMLHNDLGGHVTMTSSASRLFASLAMKNPMIKVIVSSIQSYLQRYSVGGLFPSCFSLRLIEQALTSEARKHLVSDIYELLLQESITYLSSFDCPCKVDVNFADSKVLNDMIINMLATKRGCVWSENSLQHMVALTMSAFLKSFSSTSNANKAVIGTIQYLTVVGPPISDSKVVDGVMFEAPHIPTYRSRSLLASRKSDLLIKVALFNITMSGDTENLVAASVYEVHGDMDVTDVMCQNMLQCAESLVGQGVGIVACQRVIHPRVKKYLKQHGVLVLDRLSLLYIHAVHMLIGGEILSAFTNPINSNQLGTLDAVTHCVLHGKSYLHLQHEGSTVCTMVVCNKTEEAAEELKSTCRGAQHMLVHLLQEPKALYGAGCWQTNVSAHLLNWAKQREAQTFLEQLGCTQHQFFQVTQTFCRGLNNVAMATEDAPCHLIDDVHHHHWCSHDPKYLTHVPHCACGVVLRDGMADNSLIELNWMSSSGITSDGLPVHGGHARVLDCYTLAVAGLKFGVSIANTVLQVQHCVHDVN